jgi:hypothetical protein
MNLEKLIIPMQVDAQQAEKGLSNMTKGLIGVGAAAAVAAAAVVGMAVGIAKGLESCVNAALDYGEAVDGISESTGMAGESASVLVLLAKKTGVSVEALNKSFMIFSKTIVDSNGKLGKAGLQLKKLGVQVFDANGNIRDLKKLWGEAADALNKMPDGPEKTLAIINLFGKGGMELFDMIANGGTDALKSIELLGASMGLLWSSEQVARMENFGFQMNELKLIWQGLGIMVGSEVVNVILPFVQEFVGWLNKPDAAGNTPLSIATDTLKSVLSGLSGQVGDGRWLTDFLASVSEYFSMPVGHGNMTQFALDMDKIATSIKTISDNIAAGKAAIDWFFNLKFPQWMIDWGNLERSGGGISSVATWITNLNQAFQDWMRGGYGGGGEGGGGGGVNFSPLKTNFDSQFVAPAKLSAQALATNMQTVLTNAINAVKPAFISVSIILELRDLPQVVHS